MNKSPKGTFSSLFAAAEREPAYIRIGEDRMSWKIGNGLVERSLFFAPMHGLYTEHWEHKLTGTNFLVPMPKEEEWRKEQQWRVEFEFYSGNDQMMGATPGPSAHFDLIGSETSEIIPSGKCLEIKLKAKNKPIEVSVFYAVYGGHPVVRKWISVTNNGHEPVLLNRLSFEKLDLIAAPPSEQLIWGYYGVHPREIFYTGRVEEPAIVEMNPRTGEGFVIMNEAPGWIKRTQMINFGEGISIMYDTDQFPFKRVLKPGETFTSAKSGIAFFIKDRGMADSRWVMPWYTSQIILKKGKAYTPPCFFNTWDPFYWYYTESTIKELIPIAAAMGFDNFTLDTGWSDNYNDCQVDKTKFPEGLDVMRKLLKSHGMKLGLWFPIVVVSPESQVFQEHPEWVMKDEDGNERVSDFPNDGDRFMCLDSPYGDWVARRLLMLIDKFHPQYIKMDLMTVFDPYGRWRAGCWAKGHQHENREQSLQGIIHGLGRLTEQIYRRHPEILLDISYETWGQNHLIDYGVLSYADFDWMANVNDSTPQMAGPRNSRMLLYHRSLAIPAEGMILGLVRADMPDPEERFGTAIGSTPVFMGDIRKLTPEQVKWFGEKVRWFKTLRLEVPLQESFFPLGSWYQPNVMAWDGYARLSRRGEGFIAIFKNETKIHQVEIKLPTYPAGRFKLRSIMNNDLAGVYKGEQFQEGVTIPLTNQYKVDIFEVRIK